MGLDLQAKAIDSQALSQGMAEQVAHYLLIISKCLVLRGPPTGEVDLVWGVREGVLEQALFELQFKG